MPSRSITTHKALSPKLLQFRLTLGVTLFLIAAAKCPYSLTLSAVALTFIVTETPHSTPFGGAPAVPRDDEPNSSD